MLLTYAGLSRRHPAKAGVQSSMPRRNPVWIPAFAGMTIWGDAATLADT
jgi:hypothetical protein